jgi:AcrR family transcriptional regulator
VATNEERRAETRQRLLAAAATLFAERGVDGASIDAIAERAERTSGAVYDHFASKEGLLFAVLDGWVTDAATVIQAELVNASSLDERLGVLWRNVSSPVAGDGHWIALEHELWNHAARNPEVRDRVARRYRGAWRGITNAVHEWSGTGGDVGPSIIGLLFGLEMIHRVDPAAMPDSLAVASLRSLIAGAASTASIPNVSNDSTSSNDSTVSKGQPHAHTHL